ncbi:WD40 repeat domain-containing protein [Microbacterium thalassium]|uniref:WD40 repeat domain-containing protein n=1 Tax=Microbacterium thalassium TaxID=362649 RepID=UPI0022F2462B|nr:WD40 repeat domain-containing protein [Microbacterium thalassium]GLK24737.1 hypothetical protein GCM10017607_20550 [Microbacterium thalassium]
MGEFKSAAFHVSTFGQLPPPGTLPDPDSLDPLPAAAAADQLRGALANLGYFVQDEPDLSAEELGREVFRFLESGNPEDVRIVHICSHGKPAAASDELYIVGSDGRHHRDTGVEAWVRAIEDNESDHAATLFIVDACYAGRAAELAWQISRSRADRPPRAMVLAASRWDRTAYEFRLTKALAAVLSSPKRHLDIRDTERYLPWDTVFNWVDDEMTRLDTEGTGQRPHWTPIGQRVRPAELPFFPNPDYQPPTPLEEAKQSAAVGVAALIESVDVVHFSGRAANDRFKNAADAGLFRGRRKQLQDLSTWLDAPPGDDHLRLITGSPGSGKSALLGMLVCAGLPSLRIPTRSIWGHSPHTRGPLTDVAAVHARGLNLHEVSTAISDQLGLSSRDQATTSPAGLLSAILGMDVPPTIILDALDEAADVASLVSVLVLPVLQAHRTDGKRACRLLAGSRSGDPWVEIAPLLDLASDGQILNLDNSDSGTMASDLRQFVHDALARHRVWASRPAVISQIALATSHAIVHAPPRSGGGWGEFLVASIYVDYLGREVNPHDPSSVARAAEMVPTTLPQVLELDLAHDSDGRRRRTLTTLALALGEGIPARVAQIIDSALWDPAQTTTDHDLRVSIDATRFYIRSTADEDGTTIYRLFHQSLSDHLTSMVTLEQKSRVVDAILADRTSHNGDRRWTTAAPYLARHMLEHASAAGRAVELLLDTELLVAARPQSLRAALRATNGRPREVSLVHSATPLGGTDPNERRDILALNARRYGLEDMVSKLSIGEELSDAWRPLWSTGSQVCPSLIDAFASTRSGTSAAGPTLRLGRSSPKGVTAVACTTFNERSIVVTCHRDGTLNIWDLTTRQPIGEPLTGHTDAVTTVACTTLDGHPVAVTGSWDRTVRIWDLTTRQPIGEPLTGHTDAVTAIACSSSREHMVAVAGLAADGFQLWDLNTTQLVGESPGNRGRAVMAVACTSIDDRPIAVTGGTDRTVRMWDAKTGQSIGKPLRGHHSFVTTIACTTLNGRPIAISGSWDKTVRIWDLKTGQAIGEPLTGHRGAVAAIAATYLNGHPVAVSAGDDQTLRIWDLQPPESSYSPLTGHTDLVTTVARAIVDGRETAITGSSDGTVRIWDARTVSEHSLSVWDVIVGQRYGRSLPRASDPVVGIACTTLRRRSVAVICGRQSLEIWDLARLVQLGKLVAGDFHGPTTVACTVIGRRAIAVTGGTDGTLRTWDLNRRRPLATSTQRHSARITTVACTTVEGRAVGVTGSANGTLQIWDLDSLRRIGDPLTGFGMAVRAISCTTVEGRAVGVVGGADGRLQLWDLAGAKPVAEALHSGLGSVAAVACAHVSNRPVAVTGTSDGWVQIWDLAASRELARHRVVDMITGITVQADDVNALKIVVGFGHEVAEFSWTPR